MAELAIGFWILGMWAAQATAVFAGAGEVSRLDVALTPRPKERAHVSARVDDSVHARLPPHATALFSP